MAKMIVMSLTFVQFFSAEVQLILRARGWFIAINALDEIVQGVFIPTDGDIFVHRLQRLVQRIQ